jgi:hypothetical protein
MISKSESGSPDSRTLRQSRMISSEKRGFLFGEGSFNSSSPSRHAVWEELAKTGPHYMFITGHFIPESRSFGRHPAVSRSFLAGSVLGFRTITFEGKLLPAGIGAEEEDPVFEVHPDGDPRVQIHPAYGIFNGRRTNSTGLRRRNVKPARIIQSAQQPDYNQKRHYYDKYSQCQGEHGLSLLICHPI